VSTGRKFALVRAGLILQFIALVAYVIFSTAGHVEIILPSWLLGCWLGLIYWSLLSLTGLIKQKSSCNTSTKTQSAPTWIGAFATVLVVAIWLGLLAYGAYGTVKGNLPIKWTLPVGAFLLVFMGLFYSLFRDVQAHKPYD